MDNVHVDVDCGHIDCHRVGASEGREVPVPRAGANGPGGERNTFWRCGCHTTSK